MVQTVTLPFSRLNSLPGVAGVEDVEFRIPELSDIIEAIEAQTLDRTELDEALTEALDDALTAGTGLGLDVDALVEDVRTEIETVLDDATDQLVQDFEAALADLDLPSLGDAVIEIEGSLFSIADDFVDLLAVALDSADLVEIGQFPTLEEIDSLLSDATADLGELDLPTVEDIQDAAEDALTAVLEDVPGGDILLDPDAFIDDQIDRVTDGLVSEDARQELEEALAEE